MSLNEPRIFENTPKWVGLQELSRDDRSVWFSASYGRMMVPLKYVEEYERKKNAN